MMTAPPTAIPMTAPVAIPVVGFCVGEAVDMALTGRPWGPVAVMPLIVTVAKLVTTVGVVFDSYLRGHRHRTNEP